MKLVLATANKGKLAELRSLCEHHAITVLAIGDPEVPDLDVAETGSSFAENAELKARAFSEATGLPTVADDSGLLVDALGGDPGVLSARWLPGTDQDRTEGLLTKMRGIKDRTAHFTTVVCYLSEPNANPIFFEGSISGTIATAAKGSQGFGYDPIFIPSGYTQTFAELGHAVKNTLSHRAQAFSLFVEHLQKD